MAIPRVAVIGGDGIGPEVIDQAIRVADAALRHDQRSISTGTGSPGVGLLQKTGHMMPADGWEILAPARRHPARRDRPSRRARPRHPARLLLPMRRKFDQYVNLRPAYLFDGVQSPLRDKAPGSIDMLVYRENTEGEYAPIGGRHYEGTPHEIAIQTNLFTRRGCERIIRAAFEAARRRPRKKVTSITKSNAQTFGMVLWDEVFKAVAKDYPDVQSSSLLVDAAAMDFVRKPESVRRRRRQQPVRRHPDRPERHRHRQRGPGGERQHQPGAHLPEHVRAGARLRAGHRRQGHRQPAGRHPVGRHAAGPSRQPKAAGAFARRWPPSSRPASRAHPDLGGEAKTGDMGAAVAAAV